MNIVSGKNIKEVFYGLLKKIVDEGHTFTTLHGRIKEITSVLIEIENPRERCYIIPHRYNNIFATMAETMWVMGGRDDIKFLQRYLKRAGDFSEDGVTWSGAYGKRLQNWYGINQIEELYREATKNKYAIYSRRLVAILYDPQRDFRDKLLDCPCNNWIQFIVTPENKLDMQVSLRANDIIWGFSGINQFEWSVFQEMFANWLGVEVGKYYQFVGSMDLFSRHFKRAQNILQAKANDLYKDNTVPIINVDIGHDNFKKEMDSFFMIESEIGIVDKTTFLHHLEVVESSFIRNVLMLLYVYDLFMNGKDDELIIWLENIPYNDLKVVAIEYMCRNNKYLEEKLINCRSELAIYY